MRSFAILAIGTAVCLGVLSSTIGQTPLPIPHTGTSAKPGTGTGTKSTSSRIRVASDQVVNEAYRKSNDGLNERVTALEQKIAALEKTAAALDRKNGALQYELTRFRAEFSNHTHNIDGITYITVPSVVQPGVLKVGVVAQQYLFVLNSGKASNRLTLSKPVVH